MYDTTERVKRVQQRIEQLRCKSDNRLIAGLSGLCVLLSVFLIGFIGNIAGGEHCIMSGVYGSMLMYEDAGSHILVGVISLVVGVTVTVLCIRIREKNKKIKNSKKDE